MLRILHDTNYDFIRWWKVMAAITVAFIVLGLGSLAIKPLNLSIEFTGGTLMQLEFTQPPDVGQIRSTLDAAGIHGAEIQQFGTNREFTVRAQDPAAVAAQSQGAESIAVTIEKVLKQKFGENNLKVIRTEAVGPRVGSELKRGAIIAILLSFLITLVYLSIRFEWRFATAAVIATSHDVFTTIAFLKLMHLEISLTVVAGLLTVLGYSLNDTIIIFDRVRENLRKGRKETLYETLNRSINETLPRSILTHATVLAATLSLLFFAGEVIRPFAWVMAFGIITGTFSSIYVAAPVLLWIERKWPRKTSARQSSSTATPTSRTRPSPATAARVARARDAGAGAIVCIGESIDAAATAAEIAAENAGFVFSTAGIHPHDAASFGAKRDIPKLRAFLEAGAVAVGECGLDYHYDNSPREAQRAAFSGQVALAAEMHRPVVVHTRDAEDDTRSIIGEARAAGVIGVLHCYTGTHSLAEFAIDAGWYVSFSGIVTFNKWTDDDLLRLVPRDRLLVESDSPYLAPVPHRGKRNEPAWVAHTLAKVASARADDADDLGRATAANTQRLFGLAFQAA